MNATRVLVCDDEPEIREMVGEYLEKRGFEVLLAANTTELDAVMAGDADISLILLDINMPGEDGLSALRRLRVSQRTPVIMLTAAGEPVDRVLGLEMGADDYLPKPVDLRELEARIKAVLRRVTAEVPAATVEAAAAADIAAGTAQQNATAEGKVHRFDGLTLHSDRAELIGRDGEAIPLTAMEFNMLELFLRSPGRVLNRDQLMSMAFDRDWDPYDRSIDIRVMRLRKKIELNPSKPRLLRTVRGLGYKFDPKPV